MPDAWATSGPDLHLDLADSAGQGGVRVRLEEALRAAVRSGRLGPGSRLPSSRTLAADLGLARNTVAEAYGQLVAEGWLTARQGSGTVVARVPRPLRTGGAAVAPSTGPPRFSLQPGSPDVAAFPRSAWSAAARRALQRAPNDAFGYGDPRGRLELRGALAGYLARARGVRAEPDRIVCCTGFAQALRLLTRVLAVGAGTGHARTGGARLAVEAYGLAVVPRIVADTATRLHGLELDDRGAVVEGLDRSDAAVLLTPAHQFPLGMALAPERRRQVLGWAGRTGGLVIEDDYDGEFRYGRQPVAALQGLDPERVAYLGTASKSLAPGLRLAWMVLPADLVDAVVTEKEVVDRQSPVLDQLTLAELIDNGGYDRQVRRMRLVYRRRRDQLVAMLTERHPGLAVHGLSAGLHLVLELPPGRSEAEVVAAARRRGLVVQGLTASAMPGCPSTRPPSLVIGYGTPPDHAFSGALARLAAVLDDPA